MDYPSSETAKVITSGIRDALIAITKCHSVEVAAPIAAKDAHGDPLIPLPTVYFAYNLTEYAATRLKTQVSWSTDTISFFAYDLSPTIPTLLFTLCGFTTQDPQRIEDTVRRTIFSRDYRLFTASFARDHPRFHGHSTDAVSEVLMQSLKVTVSQCVDSGIVAVNVYCTPPTTSPELWCLWRNTLGAAEYVHSFVGEGTRVDLTCAGCHGAGHSAGDCPFSRLLGWNTEHALRSE